MFHKVIEKLMAIRQRSLFYRYVTGFAIYAIFLLLFLLIRPYILFSGTPVVLTSIVLSAWLAGTGPGVMMVFLWIFTANYLSPNHATFALHLRDGDLPRMVVLLLTAGLAGRLRKADHLRRVRARQQAVIATLSQRALGGTLLEQVQGLGREAGRHRRLVPTRGHRMRPREEAGQPAPENARGSRHQQTHERATIRGTRPQT